MKIASEQAESRVPFPILYEDEHIIAVEKPAGLLTVPTTGSTSTKTVQGRMQAWAAKHTDYKPYLLHRLDRDTTGVILLGKHPRDREALEGIFKSNATKKGYLALVKGTPRPPKGTIKIPLEARSRPIKVYAITHYQVIERYADCSLLKVQIETGRKHQIRKHLALIGNPLALDPLYGDRRFNFRFRKRSGTPHMQLTAEWIEFIHPFTKELLRIGIQKTPQAQ